MSGKMLKLKRTFFNGSKTKDRGDPDVATKDLLAAVRRGNGERVSTALSRGANQLAVLPEDDPDDPGGSLMTLAARLGHGDAISILLDAGTPVDLRGHGTRTPLYRAAYFGHPDVVARLVAAGAELEAREGDFACTPLHVAAQQGHPSCIQELVQAGADMYARDIWASIPLHRAAMNNKPEAILQLLECGCDPQVKNKFGKSALHFAALGGGLESAKVLVMHNLSYHEKDGQGFSALDIARVYSHHEIEWWFLKNPSAEIMLLPTVLPEEKDSECSTSGSLARTSPSGPPKTTKIAATETNPAGAIDTEVTSGNTTDPKKTTFTSQTNTITEDKAQHASALTADKISVTIRKAVSTLKPNISPDTRHIMATKSLRIEEELSKSILDYIRRGASHLLINIHHSHDGHYQDKNGLTPLHWAVTLKQPGSVRALLDKHKVFPEALTYSGETPGDLARQAGNNEVLDIIKRFKVIKAENPEDLYEELLTVIGSGDDVVKVSELLCQGAPLEPVGGLSTHALSLAVTSNRRKVVSLLIAAGAPLTSMAGGLTLLQQAWNSPDVTIRVQMLITRAYKNRLQWEKRQFSPREDLLHQGIDQMLERLEGPTPWRTKWKFMGVRTLTALMCTAARHNCTLTAFFLQQAGAQTFLVSEDGFTALHAALQVKHWSLASAMVKDMSASLYISDASGCLPRDMMPDYLRVEIEEALHAKEKRKLDDMYEKLKDESEKEDVQKIIQLSDDLFSIYQTADGSSDCEIPTYFSSIVCASLSVAAQRGLLQLMYMVVRVCGIRPDTVVDYTNDTTALHLAAAHGISGCVALLLDLNADPLQPDKYGHTALHFAVMNCHDSTYQLLAAMVQEEEEPVSVAGTVPSKIKENVEKYLQLYQKTETAVKNDTSIPESTDPAEATVTLLKQVGLKDIVDDCSDFSIDFSEGEAREVSTAVLRECQIIASGVASQDKTYEGTLTLVGSSSDGTRLYAPDECDISIVLSNIPDVEVTVVEQNEREVLDCGHRLRIEVRTDAPNFQGNRLIENFFSLVTRYLECHNLHDERLSVVPPGVTRTQVGVSLSFAWQGSQYPLLLVGVDLVPVLPLPWPKDVLRPALTPPDIRDVHLSNKADGTWRCSFAGAEVAVISQLSPEERRVFLSCKTLLSRLKAEVWMPRDVKSQYTWWDSRQWKIPIPAGFALKNAFLNILEQKRKEGTEWHERDLLKWMIKVFREMCDSHVESVAEHGEARVETQEVLLPKKVYAYFGGDFEKPKVGDGAPDIINILEQQLEDN
ncbi:serine/threonine-protein phosphatase 6 regulatory ankyrin repeat subunit C-like isoform X2 [Penaeus japonicus]|uniref:serine/threonine-protein phosphatase 6 regulatory ankyrin repeat subunit C-like isoform X2 n=1 Tax=Penaeus japonicus TaxID=27405 RepID=UPI001C70D538|nr:serine/threonine-protein phosphatase 6 regulatory ankyrin repeat subunit C-like isoform X2 [Penaeus japonicus]